MVLLNFAAAERLRRKHRRTGDYDPPVHLSPEELKERYSEARKLPTETINYAQELGTVWPAWPKALKIDPVTHIGRTEHLLRAVYGAEVVPTRTRRRGPLGRVDAMGTEHVGDWDDLPLAIRAWRVMGREQIASWLGVRADEVPRWRRDFPGYIHKVGKLLVADTQRLNDLLVFRARKTSAARSRANKKPRRAAER